MRRLAHLHARATKGAKKLNEPIWHVQLAILAVVLLQLVLDSRLSFGPKYLVGGIELVLLGTLMIVAHTPASLVLRRTVAIMLTAIVTITNVLSLALVIRALFGHNALATYGVNGQDLLVSSLSIYLTNLVVFGLWYWEMDFKAGNKPQDFLFAQMNAPEHAGLHNQGWRPTFFDYLYVSITNATAFSPTDTLPLTHRAKALMALQSLVSLTVVVLATARAVNAIG
jgi:uncharacterized membrane protein